MKFFYFVQISNNKLKTRPQSQLQQQHMQVLKLISTSLASDAIVSRGSTNLECNHNSRLWTLDTQRENSWEDTGVY